MEEIRNAYNVFVERDHLRETELEVVDRIHVILDRGQWQAVLNTMMNHWVP
jgi:hypothetical protein